MIYRLGIYLLPCHPQASSCTNAGINFLVLTLYSHHIIFNTSRLDPANTSFVANVFAAESIAAKADLDPEIKITEKDIKCNCLYVVGVV